MATLTVPTNNARKPWYQSRTMWGALLCATSGFVAAVVPSLDPSAPAWVHLIANGASMAGGGLAAYGRYLSTTPTT